MYYVKNANGKYYLASPQWSLAYEEGLLSDNGPAACFVSEADAKLFLATKERGTNTSSPAADADSHKFHKHNSWLCPPDCKFRFGHLNEETCDYCIRKGNIRDFYQPEREEIF